MFAKFSVRKPFTVLVAVVLVLVLGVVSFSNMTPDLLPSIDLPYVIVVTTYVGASPEAVEEEVTKPIEQSMATMDGIKSLSSTSSENVSMITMEFEDDVDMNYTSLKIRERVDALQSGWNEKVGTPTILQINPDMLPVSVAAVSMEGADIYELSEFVEGTLLQRLEGVEGVASISTSGIVDKSLAVTLSEEKIEALNDKLRAEIDEQFADAERELGDAKTELEDKLGEANDGRDALADGREEIAEQQKKLMQELAAARNELNANQEALAAGKLEIVNAQAELAAQLTTLDETHAQLSELLENAQALEEAISQLEDGITALREAENTAQQLEQADAAMVAAVMSMGMTESQARSYLSAHSPEYQQLTEGMRMLSEQLSSQGFSSTTLFATIGDMERQLKEAKSALKAIDEGLAEQGMTREDIPEKLEEIAAGREQLVEAQAELDAKLAEVESGEKTIEDALEELTAQEASASQQLSAALTEVIVNQSALDSGVTQLESALEEIEKQRDSMADAQEDAYKAANMADTITMTMVAQILYAQNFSMPAGYVQDGVESVLVRVGEEIDTVEALSELLLFENESLGAVRLGDVAEIEVVDNSDETYGRINGENGVLLSFSKQSGYATATVSENILAKMDEISADYEDIRFTTLMDQGDSIDLIVSSVLENLVLGAILAILILMLFLRDLRPTVVIACSIPLSVMFAIVLMYFSGVTLNIISLSGLAVAVGMLVDNSIVVIENIYRLRNLGVSRIKAAVSGTVQVTAAITASTLTTVCVFVPIAFIDGLTRQLFMDMALTIGYSLLASLIVALTLVPCIAAGTLRKTKEDSRWLVGMQDWYEKLLKFCLNRRAIALVLAVALLVLSVVLAVSKGFTYMPDVESTEVMVSLYVPEHEDGSAPTLEETAALADEAAARIMEIEGVETVGAMLSSGMTAVIGISGSGGSTDSVTMYALLEDDAAISMNLLAKEIETRCADLPCEISASSQNSMSSMASGLGGSGIGVRIYGNDLDVLQQLAYDVGDQIAAVEGVAEVSDGRDEAVRELRIVFDRDLAMKEGLTVAQAYQQLAASLAESAGATTLRTDGDSLTVNIINGSVPTASELPDYVFKATGADGTMKELKLSDIASIEEGESLPSIQRSEQRRYINVSATVAEGHNVTLVAADVEEALDDFELPVGCELVFTGENETIMSAMEDLLLLLALGILIVYLIMVAQFQSLKSPFIVLFVIPLAMTGGLLALLICGMEISVVAMIGFVMLVGVIVNNGIVLVDAINQLRAEGKERREAIVEACRMRMRPVLMTALTTILGLLPMGLGIGTGAGLVQPVAVVSIGGLVYATLMTLLIVPIVYDLLHKKALKVISDEELEVIND
ncbi:MAG: acriflavin resistance protein [Ruminococcaceae bacterium]|nr:acriflavin resistance protein [Oscillospiraceae bacterium]